MIEIKQQHLTDELNEAIATGFREHAIATVGEDEKLDPVAFVAYDGTEFAGAVVGQIFWGTLHIKKAYVARGYRGQNIGARLMHQALEYGRAKGCAFAFVETMNFQALGFYQKLGFSLDFTRPGYKHGTSFHYLSKDLK